MNGFPAWMQSPMSARMLRVQPAPERFAARPASDADAGALLARLDAAPAAYASAVAALDENSAAAVMFHALYWDGWLESGMEQLATGGRLKMGGNVALTVGRPATPAAMAARLGEMRAANLAEARTRGASLWDQAGDRGGTPLTAHQGLSAIAAMDDERLSIARGEG